MPRNTIPARLIAAYRESYRAWQDCADAINAKVDATDAERAAAQLECHRLQNAHVPNADALHKAAVGER